MNMKGSDLVVAALENEGVERIFAVPGEENLDVVESLRNSKIELVITRHEQAAAFVAATYGRLTGKAGVCLSTLGPGALNFSTGAAYALLGAMPLVLNVRSFLYHPLGNRPPLNLHNSWTYL
jgi:acetolactate synthase I/II/III large subunit